MKKNVWKRGIFIHIKGKPETLTDQQKGECIKWKREGTRVNPYIHHYTKNEVIAYHNRLAWHLKPYKPSKTLTGPVAVYITWYFPTDKKKLWGKPKVTRPDTDNMAKGIIDVMTHLKYWTDDNQVCESCFLKYWSSPEEAGTQINIYYDHAGETIEAPNRQIITKVTPDNELIEIVDFNEPGGEET